MNVSVPSALILGFQGQQEPYQRNVQIVKVVSGKKIRRLKTWLRNLV